MINEELEQSKVKTRTITNMFKNSWNVLERRNLILHLQEELDTFAMEANSSGYEYSLYCDEDA